MPDRACGRPLAIAAALVLAAAACAAPTEPTRPLSTGSPPTPGLTSGAPSLAPAESLPPAFDFGAPEVIATGLEVPWAIAFLPNGDALITERESGRILRLAPGGVPEEVARIDEIAAGEGEGGLLGIAVSPTYADDGWLFAFSSTATGSRISRLRLGEEAEVILEGIPGEIFHTGGRLAFGPDGELYAAVGDGRIAGAPQNPDSLAGKILRLEPDGSVPSDNPTPSSAVWSLGHRNVEGFTWDDGGRMWATEFGENDFDELNLIEPGANYGWPEVEGVGGAPRFRDPLVTWTPAEASPAGVAHAWGHLWVAALRGTRLWSVPIHDWTPGAPVPLLEGEFGRLRAVELAPDGSLWIATSNRDGRGEPHRDDDRIVRIPAVRP